jgi:hypothetical protein
MDLHRRRAVLENIRQQVEHALLASGGELARMRELAVEAAEAVEAISPVIERHTSVVCPGCLRVCCVNRHSYRELGDVVCLSSLGERPPAYREGAPDSDPCQFLGERGCLLRRSLRPHRSFVAALGNINRKRGALLSAFDAVMRAQGGDPAALKRSSDEIFFRYENLPHKFDIL